MCHLQNNNINQKHSHWTSVGNGLARLSATACQLHFRKSSGSGAAFRNVLKGFQGMYKISKIISGAATTQLSTSGPRLEGGANSNLVKFKEDQCKLLDLWRKNPSRMEAGGGWAGKKLCGSFWCHGASWAIHKPADTRHGPSMYLGIGLTPSTLHSRDHGLIQCLVLGLPQYKTWTSWCGEPPGWSGLKKFPVRRGWRMGCLSLGQRWLQGGWRRVTQFPHSNGTMLILLLCTPFLINHMLKIVWFVRASF